MARGPWPAIRAARSAAVSNAVGRAQAERAARSLAGHSFGSIIASPLSRARDTAAAVAAVLGQGFTIDHDLREVEFGEQ
ncbi:hypothetical protein EBR04_07580, partial [bacterium]|nr:hypothetical protein [bacterium]